MAKFGTSLSIGMLATVGDGDGVDVGTRGGSCASIRDGDGVDVGTGDGPCASRWDENGLTSVEGGDVVVATLEDLTGIDTIDRVG